MRSRPALWALAILVGFHLAIIWRAPLLPFVDLPEHLAAATVCRYYHAAGNHFSEYYSLASPGLFKSAFFHLVFCSCPIFPSVEIANKVYFSLYIILLPVAVLLLIRRFGGNAWFSLLSLTLIYNYSVTWGFVNYAMAIPLLLVLFWLRCDPSPRHERSRALLLAGGLLLLFWMHAQTALYCAFIFLLLTLVSQQLSSRTLLRTGAVMAPLLLVYAGWWWSDRSPAGADTVGLMADYYRKTFLADLPSRIQVLTNDNWNLVLTSRAVGRAIKVVFLAITVLPVTWVFVAKPFLSAKFRRPSTGPPAILLLTALGAYLLLPDHMLNVHYVYQRLSVFFVLACIVLQSVLAERPLRRLKPLAWGVITLICTVSVGHLFLWSNYLDAFQRDAGGIRSGVLPDRPNEATLAALIYQSTFQGSPVYVHFEDYYIVWERGIATSKMLDYRKSGRSSRESFWPVTRRAGLEVLPRYNPWVEGHDNYHGEYAGMDYILVRGAITEAGSKYLQGYRTVAENGAWRLLQKPPGVGSPGAIEPRRGSADPGR